MGIDWFMVRFKSGADPDELTRLIREQAVAFQTLYGWFDSTSEDNPLLSGLLTDLHGPAYRAASDALAGLAEFPEYDDATGRATDYPDLAVCWRVYPITSGPIFPPLVRFRAGRTYLPADLQPQLDAWRTWAEQVAHGDHDDYLQELHWYETARWARYHWSCLHAAAVDSLTRDANWARRPELAAVREQILRLPQPTVPAVRLSPDGKPKFEQDELAREYPAALAVARTLVELTRAWDSKVKHKLRYYEECYRLTLDEFRAAASDDWLREFFAWAGRCADLGFGLYLDY